MTDADYHGNPFYPNAGKLNNLADCVFGKQFAFFHTRKRIG
jgi:hypothetical protein